MSEIYKLLSSLLSSGKLVSLHYDPRNMSACSVGYVDALDQEYVRLKAISSYGSDAGYEIRRIDEIFKVDIDGAYEKKLSFLRMNAQSIFDDQTLPPPADKQKSLLDASLEQAMALRLITVVWCADSADSIIGYVKAMISDSITIESIDEMGRPDGEVLLAKNTIESIDCNSNKCQVISFLNKEKFYENL